MKLDDLKELEQLLLDERARRERLLQTLRQISEAEGASAGQLRKIATEALEAAE